VSGPAEGPDGPTPGGSEGARHVPPGDEAALDRLRAEYRREQREQAGGGPRRPFLPLVVALTLVAVLALGALALTWLRPWRR
jgi:hypothetical protein